MTYQALALIAVEGLIVLFAWWGVSWVWLALCALGSWANYQNREDR